MWRRAPPRPPWGSAEEAACRFSHRQEGTRLLDFINTEAGTADGPPVPVRPARYHGACNGDFGKRPKCQPGKLVVCDNCYGMVELPELLNT